MHSITFDEEIHDKSIKYAFNYIYGRLSDIVKCVQEKSEVAINRKNQPKHKKRQHKNPYSKWRSGHPSSLETISAL